MTQFEHAKIIVLERLLMAVGTEIFAEHYGVVSFAAPSLRYSVVRGVIGDGFLVDCYPVRLERKVMYSATEAMQYLIDATKDHVSGDSDMVRLEHLLGSFIVSAVRNKVYVHDGNHFRVALMDVGQKGCHLQLKFASNTFVDPERPLMCTVWSDFDSKIGTYVVLKDLSAVIDIAAVYYMMNVNAENNK